MYRELAFYHKNPKGDDISDIIRGKIMMLEEILEFKNVFKAFDKLEKTVKDAEKGA